MDDTYDRKIFFTSAELMILGLEVFRKTIVSNSLISNTLIPNALLYYVTYGETI